MSSWLSWSQPSLVQHAKTTNKQEIKQKLLCGLTYGRVFTLLQGNPIPYVFLFVAKQKPLNYQINQDVLKLNWIIKSINTLKFVPPTETEWMAMELPFAGSQLKTNHYGVSPINQLGLCSSLNAEIAVKTCRVRWQNANAISLTKTCEINQSRLTKLNHDICEKSRTSTHMSRLPAQGSPDIKWVDHTVAFSNK